MSAPGRIPESVLEEIRQRLPIEAVVGRRVQLRRAGAAWLKGLCPFHDERKPSFAVRPRDRTFHCFGCGEHGDVIGFVMRAERCSYPQAVARCAAECGVAVEADAGPRRAPWAAPPAPPPRPPEPDRRSAPWLIFEREARPLTATGPAARYLRGRGLWPLPAACLAALHDATLRHPDTGPALHPVMLARVEGPDGTFAAIHRTYLEEMPDGTVRKLRRVEAAKLTFGPLSGGAVRLFPVAARLGVAEGIETALAASRLHDIPVWACIAAGILEGFEPPPDVEDIVIFADADAPRAKPWRPEGQGMHSARVLAERLRARAIRVEIRTPLPPHDDYADVLAARELVG